ncbi:MAG: DUF1561 family protein [Helicobacter sp.]|nr:DUF1561 family protein [Helicobacter sp.]
MFNTVNMRFIIGGILLASSLFASPDNSKPPINKVVNFKPKSLSLNKDDKKVGELLSLYDALYKNDELSKKLKNDTKAVKPENSEALNKLKLTFKKRQQVLFKKATQSLKLYPKFAAKYARFHDFDFNFSSNANLELPNVELNLQVQNVSEKLADLPKDQALKVRLHNGSEYCFSPVWTKGDGYAYLVNCSYASKARYDVFGRIAWSHQGTWICLTAPSSITGIEGQASESWDYMRIRPCVTNDANQRFIIKDSAIYTADSKFRIKDYGWYAYISKNKDDYYNHTLSGMDTWVKTIARPGTLTIKTFIGWSFVDRFQWAVYYLQNNRSFADSINWLYYNPENGHIAQYYQNTGYLYCMSSNAKKGQDWNWVSWNYCNDDLPKTKAKNATNWEFFELIDNEGYLRDYLGNLLRISEYGPNWGVPWVGSIDYIQKRESKTNVPKSLFLFSNSVPYWERYVNGNLGETLEYCPAPGHAALNTNANTNTQNAMLLPPSFNLTPEWINRLYQVAITAPSGPSTIGVCGTCLLHSFEMVAEMMRNQFSTPPAGRGVFFDLSRGSDPATSLRARYPLLAQRLEGTRTFANRQYSADEDLATRSRRLLYNIATMMLPEYDWHMYDLINTDTGLDSLVTRMLRAPTGTLWVAAMNRTLPTGGFSGHVQPILRTNDGLVLIPTNANVDFAHYSQFLQPVMSGTQMRNNLSLGGTRQLITLALIEVTNRHVNRADTYFSNHSCTGSGSGRRGSGQMPLSATINQCSGGRCLIQ